MCVWELKVCRSCRRKAGYGYGYCHGNGCFIMIHLGNFNKGSTIQSSHSNVIIKNNEKHSWCRLLLSLHISFEKWLFLMYNCWAIHEGRNKNDLNENSKKKKTFKKNPIKGHKTITIYFEYQLNEMLAPTFLLYINRFIALATSYSTTTQKFKEVFSMYFLWYIINLVWTKLKSNDSIETWIYLNVVIFQRFWSRLCRAQSLHSHSKCEMIYWMLCRLY